MKSTWKIGAVASLAALSFGLFSSSIHAQQAPKSGDVFAWGENYYGAVGNNSQYDVFSPVHTLGLGGGAPLSDITAVAAGTFYNLALNSDGTVWAWGRDFYDTLGVNDFKPSGDDTMGHWTPWKVHGPGDVGYLNGIIAIDAGLSLSLAVSSNGTVYQWGTRSATDGMGGQYLEGIYAPEAVSGLSNVVSAVSGGMNFALALKSDGTVWAWGDNLYSQLGNGTNGGSTPTPQPVKGPGGVGTLTGIVDIDASGIYIPNFSNVDIACLAVKADGTVWGWGGQYTTPVQIPGISNVAKISHGVALKKDGTIADLTNQLVGYDLTDVADASLGIAIKKDGTVWTWGWNMHGELGNTVDPFFKATTATQVNSLTHAFAVASGTTRLVLNSVVTNTPPPPSTPSPVGPFVKASVLPGNVQGSDNSFNASLSNKLAGNQQYLAFVTAASNILGGTPNNVWNVLVKNLATGAFKEASTSSTGQRANSWSFFPSISAEGSKVAFTSYATNLVSGDTNGTWDVFVKNLQTGQTSVVSTSATNVLSNNSSGFYGLSMSGDGNSVAYTSFANNLVPGYGSGYLDVYVKNLATGAVVRANTSSTGQLSNFNSFWPSISGDGKRVAFVSFGTDLIPSDMNGTGDIFVKDLTTGQLGRIAPAMSEPNGYSTYPAISSNGQYVVFASLATNLSSGQDINDGYDIFVADLSTGVITRVSSNAAGDAGNAASWAPSISGDGRYVAFYSHASDLVAGDTNGASDVFVKDMQTGSIWRASLTADGKEADAGRTWSVDTGMAVSLSADASALAFDSGARNLVPGDTDYLSDVFTATLTP